MLESDEPKGQPNPIWFDLYATYKIEYNALPKKYQKKLRKEHALRQSMYRLTKNGFIKPLLIAQQNASLPSPKAYGYSFYSLTQTGRLAAEKLNRTAKDRKEIEKALHQLRVLGNSQVILSQIHEVLWEVSLERFISREEFDKYWNKTKLGLILQKYRVERTRVGKNDGRRKYYIDS
jgi:hypothetical protein